MGKDIWDKEKIKQGFIRFLEENKRLPTAIEIDKAEYLPSSRQIQRRWGGLEKIRIDLGHEETHFGKGRHRSRIAHESNAKGRNGENTLQKMLCNHFGEMFVHIERPLDNKRKLRADFYVFNPQENFCCDVFSTDTVHNISTHLSIKCRKYVNYEETLYFVLDSVKFTQEELDNIIQRKRIPLPKNIRVITIDYLKDLIQSFPSYKM